MKLKIAAVCLLLTACTANAPTADTVQTVPSTALVTTVSQDNADVSEGTADDMYSRALINEGSRSRLAKAMDKARNGGSITVGVIGGSITQGSLASSPEKCYAELFCKYWKEKFPSCDVEFVNAGIGGTDSYLGVHRVDKQLLSYSPDVVIVEFSVNDTDKLINKYSYDSLVRKILLCESEPAVILLFTTQQNGTSMQDIHSEIGKAYDLPMISYRDAVYPEVAAGTLDWKTISPDNIHPNDAGHAIIGQLLSEYLDCVYDVADSIDISDTSFDIPAYTADYYRNAAVLGASEVDITEMSGFEYSDNRVYPELFADNFVTSEGGTLIFDTDCACLGFFYLKQTDGKGGRYDVFIDGKHKGVLDADFSGGWGNYGDTKQVLIGKEKEHHTVEIRLAEGSEKTALTILGVMQS